MSVPQSLRWDERCLRSFPVRRHKEEETEREGECVCVCEQQREREGGREEVTSPGFVLGSYLRLEPVVAIQMQED